MKGPGHREMYGWGGHVRGYLPCHLTLSPSIPVSPASSSFGIQEPEAWLLLAPGRTAVWKVRSLCGQCFGTSDARQGSEGVGGGEGKQRRAPGDPTQPGGPHFVALWVPVLSWGRPGTRSPDPAAPGKLPGRPSLRTPCRASPTATPTPPRGSPRVPDRVDWKFREMTPGGSRELQWAGAGCRVGLQAQSRDRMGQRHRP